MSGFDYIVSVYSQYFIGLIVSMNVLSKLITI
jgi:hypothetical protein